MIPVRPGVLRVAVTLATLTVLAVTPTPAGAGSGKATVTSSALPTVLTFSDRSVGDVRHGQLKIKFKTDQSTATHALLTLGFIQQPASSTGVLITNVRPNSDGCSADLGPPTIYTCDLGNVPGNSTLVRNVEFQSPDITSCTVGACSLTIDVSVSFAEGGSDSGLPQGMKNDTVKPDVPPSISLFSPADKVKADGGCRPADKFPTTFGAQASASAPQASQVTLNAFASPEPSSFGDVSFPCTAGATGVRQLSQAPPPPLHSNQVWFVDLQRSSRPADMVLTVFDLGGVKRNDFVLRELVNHDPSQTFVVPLCTSDGSVPVVPPGPKEFPNILFDSCEVSRRAYGHSGIQLNLKVNALGDPDYDW